jgi:hypothetical protein
MVGDILGLRGLGSGDVAGRLAEVIPPSGLATVGAYLESPTFVSERVAMATWIAVEAG